MSRLWAIACTVPAVMKLIGRDAAMLCCEAAGAQQITRSRSIAARRLEERMQAGAARPTALTMQGWGGGGQGAGKRLCCLDSWLGVCMHASQVVLERQDNRAHAEPGPHLAACAPPCCAVCAGEGEAAHEGADRARLTNLARPSQGATCVPLLRAPLAFKTHPTCEAGSTPPAAR